MGLLMDVSQELTSEYLSILFHSTSAEKLGAMRLLND